MRTKLLVLASWFGLVGCGAVESPSTAAAKLLTLAPLFGDHMVLPAECTVPVRGRGPVGGRVRVSATWGGRAEAAVDAEGRWQVELATPVRGGPHRLEITCGAVTRTLQDVLVGDVWLASGQSNMEMALGKHSWSGGIRDHEALVAAADLPLLRVFTVERQMGNQPQEHLAGRWVVASPATAAQFSAVGFLFARDLLAAGKAPLGLVVSAWGGTVCEAWASESGLQAFPTFTEAITKQRQAGTPVPLATRRAAFWQAVDGVAERAAEPVAMPDPWSEELADFDGVATYRCEFVLPPALRGRDGWLELGPIDDMDTVWWNDQRLAATEEDGAANRARRYRVPSAWTAVDRVALRVRVVDLQGAGGFRGAAGSLRLVADGGDAAVELGSDWRRSIDRPLRDLPAWPRPDSPNRPTVLWNGMIAPLAPFPFTGAIWYQGESNRMRAEQYAELFPAMIRDWRRVFGSALPFFFVQIAPYGYDKDSGQTAELREAQAAALALPNTGMVVTLDCGDARDIHPTWKQPVGERLAALALAKHYGERRECDGPTFVRADRDGGQLRLQFEGLAGGAQLLNDGAGFEVAGADDIWHEVAASLAGDTVVLALPAGLVPTQLRYAWAAVPKWSLANGSGLPAAPFRAQLR